MAGWETEQRTRLPDKRPSYITDPSLPPSLPAFFSKFVAGGPRPRLRRHVFPFSSPSHRPGSHPPPFFSTFLHSYPTFFIDFCVLDLEFHPETSCALFFFFICPPRFYVLEMTATSFAPQFSTSSVLFWPFG